MLRNFLFLKYILKSFNVELHKHNQYLASDSGASLQLL